MFRHALIVIGLLCVIATSGAHAQDVTISIDEILSDEAIVGHVRGLDSEKIPHHRVVVYVRTDIWYIHPYAGQGEGLSWAEIRPDGKWVIETVRRKFAADEVAALVINENHPVPNRTRSLERIRYLAITVKALIGTEDFGKL